MTFFSTAEAGIIPGTGGDVDHVARKLAWLEAHPGGTAGVEVPGQLIWTARWPGGEEGAIASGLGKLMDKLDRAEEEGRCPVHRAAAR